MPLKRKLIKVGKDSRAVILPREWIEEYEDKCGSPIEYILMEVDNAITLVPLKPKEKGGDRLKK